MKIFTMLNFKKMTGLLLLLVACLGINAQTIEWNEEGTAYIMRSDHLSTSQSELRDPEYTCPDGSVYGNLPSDPLVNDVIGSYSGSWLGQELIGIDAPISGIKIYAVSYDITAGTICEAEPREIELRFHNDSLGLPGEIVFETVQIIEGEETGNFIQYDNAPVRSYTIMFDHPIYLPNGWFSIRSNEGNCDLHYPVHYDGQGILAQNDEFWAPLTFFGPFSLSFCLLYATPEAEAPAYADNFVVTPAPTGALQTDISWTNPSIDMSANPLEELTEMQLYVDNEMVYSVTDPIIGGSETFQYNATMHKTYDFHLYGINSAGIGSVVYDSKFVGMDVPATPTNGELVNVDENGFITWTPPTEGLHGGYFDGIINGYTLVRYPDNTVLNVSGDLAEYTDESIPMPYAYKYVITALGSMGTSDSLSTNTLNLGGGIERTLVIAEKVTMIVDPYCPSAANGFRDLQENGHSVGLISYNYNDGYEFPDVDNRLIFNNFPALPTTSFGGKFYLYGGYDNPSVSLYDDYLPLVTQRFDLPTYLTVEIENANYTANTFSADVVIEAIEDVDNETIVLQAVLTESHIQEDWFNQTEVNHVVRDMYNGAAGTSIDLQYNTPLTIPITFTLDETWDASNCEVIVFVQDTLDREIFNGNKVTNINVGINESLERHVQLSPNPATDYVNITSEYTIESITVYNYSGQIVTEKSIQRKQVDLNTSKLISGIYFVKIVSNNSFITKKLIVE